MARLNTKQIIAVSLETAMQNVGIAVLVLQVTKLVWMVMFIWLTPDMDIVQVLFTSYDIHPQSNLESPYGDMALLSVIGYLLSRCFCKLRSVCLSICFLFELS